MEQVIQVTGLCVVGALLALASLGSLPLLGPLTRPRALAVRLLWPLEFRSVTSASNTARPRVSNQTRGFTGCRLGGCVSDAPATSGESLTSEQSRFAF